MSLAVRSAGSTTLEAELPDWVYDALEDDTDFRDFYVTKGLGAGGTYGGCIWHLAMCFLNQKSRTSWAVAPTFSHIADPLIPTFTEVLTSVYQWREGLDFSVVASGGQPRIDLRRTGQTIALKSASTPHRLVGANISHAFGTEPGLWPSLAFQKITDRVRCPRAARRQKLLEGTPEGLGNEWERIANFSGELNEETNARRIILETRDNPVLAEQYLRKLEQTYSYDPQKLESYLRGRFVAFTRGTAYWEFRESRNVTLGVKVDPTLPVIITWDWGVSPLAWVALQRQPYVTRHGMYRHRFVVLAEGTGEARGIEDGCAEFIAQLDPATYRSTPIEIDGGHDGYSGSHLRDGCAFDMVERILRQYYANVRVVANRSAPQVRERLERAAQICSRELLVVAAWCRNVIASLTQSSLKPGKWELEKKKGKDPTHFGDALCCPLWRMTQHEDLDDLNATPVYGLNRPL